MLLRIISSAAALLFIVGSGLSHGEKSNSESSHHILALTQHDLTSTVTALGYDAVLFFGSEEEFQNSQDKLRAINLPFGHIITRPSPKTLQRLASLLNPQNKNTKTLFVLPPPSQEKQASFHSFLDIETTQLQTIYSSMAHYDVMVTNPCHQIYSGPRFVRLVRVLYRARKPIFSNIQCETDDGVAISLFFDPQKIDIDIKEAGSQFNATGKLPTRFTKALSIRQNHNLLRSIGHITMDDQQLLIELTRP